MVVPFDQFLPWPSFSIKLKMPKSADDANEIVTFLELLPTEDGLRMHELLGQHRCWFDYGPDVQDDCSPYVGLLKLLNWQQRANYPRSFWKPSVDGSPSHQ